MKHYWNKKRKQKRQTRNTLGLAQYASEIFNILTGRGKAEALTLHVYGNRLALKDGRGPKPAVYESLFYGDPRKDARAMARVIDLISDRIGRRFGAESVAAFRSQLAASVGA